jgi:hypothetical protein
MADSWVSQRYPLGFLGQLLEKRFIRTGTSRGCVPLENTLLMALRNPGFKVIFRT